MRTRARGLSLLEALFGMLVSFMVLSAVTFVLQQSVAVGGTHDEQGIQSEVYHAFSLIRRDITGALVVTEPTTAFGSRIVLQTIDPSLTFAARVANNDPFEPGERVVVRYLWSDNLLQRELFRGGALADRQRILVCGSFETWLEGTLVSVKVTLPMKRVEKVFNMECRIRPG